ncbi:protein translocase subunit SecF [bacterium]|nr:protein translocase subunit SecF [bacterium]
MGTLNITGSDVVSLIIWAIVLVAAIIWSQGFRTRARELMKYRKYYYIFSGVVIAFCLIGIFGKGLNFGLDFTGGTILELGSPQVLTQSSTEIAEIVKKKYPTFDVTVQLGDGLVKSAEGKDYQKVLVRVRSDATTEEVGLNSQQANELRAELEKALGVGQLENISETTIGPTISGELKSGAFKALLIASILQLIYITFRFGNQLRFGTSAVLAVFHDAIVMIGFYAWAGLPVDSSFVAAVLTITSYSLMDTVVVFDRIREHMHKDLDSTFEELTNKSVCETMTRSMNTSLTTIVVCICLFYMGGESLKGFAYSLLVGIIAGAYSSIFFSSPLVIDFDRFAKERDAKRADEIRREAEEQAKEKAASAASRRRGNAPRQRAERPVLEKSEPAEASAPAAEGEGAAEAAPKAAPAAHAAAPAPEGYRSRRRVKGMRRK